MPIRVLVVDDAVVIRKILTDVIGGDPELEVVGTASNGKIALQRIEQLRPDIITLDVEMPEMDGLETLKAIRETDRATPIIMFSTLSTKGGEITLEALANGATDYVAKPANVGSAREAYDQVSNELLPRLKLFGGKSQALSQGLRSAPPVSKPVIKAVDSASAVRAVMVGSSTGGPEALDNMLSGITEPLPVPMLIVQHMPPVFTKSLAERLDRRWPSRVVEAAEGDEVEPGTVYIAPGGSHMVLTATAGGAQVKLHDGPLVNSCRPAVDELFQSALDIYGGEQLVVMLTGMGHDGREGSRVLRDAGADVYAQDEATSVVWGMPGAVVNDAIACEVLPIGEIGSAIMKRVNKSAVGASRPLIRPGSPL